MHEATIASGPITNWLAIIGVVSLIYWGWRIVAALMNRGKTDGPGVQTPAAVAPAAARAGQAPVAASTVESDIAVIAAAVFAVVGAHRIVHLQADTHDQNWAVEGRWMQQTSHRTRA
jgi:hypothetical protein